MARFARANAVPETALVISLSLLVLFGVIQLALVSFAQISADGATFVAGQKDVAILGSAADQPSAQKIAASVFTQIAQNDVVAGGSASGAALFETDVTKQFPTLQVPGFPSTFPIQSRSVEPGVDASSGTSLLDFCAAGNGSPGNPAFFLSDTVNSATPSASLNIVNNAAGTINPPALMSNDTANPGHVEDLQAVADGLDLLQSSLEDVLTTAAHAVPPLLGIYPLDPVVAVVRPLVGTAFILPIPPLVPLGLVPSALAGSLNPLLNLTTIVSNLLLAPPGGLLTPVLTSPLLNITGQTALTAHVAGTDVPNIVKALNMITTAEHNLRSLPNCP